MSDSDFTEAEYRALLIVEDVLRHMPCEFPDNTPGGTAHDGCRRCAALAPLDKLRWDAAQADAENVRQMVHDD